MMPRDFKMHRPAKTRMVIAPLKVRPARPVSRERLERASRRTDAVADSPAHVARPKEIGGPKGPEPTRYGDWERNGICYDF